MTVSGLLLILAIILFVLAAFDNDRWRDNLVTLGLAFFAAALLAARL